MAALQSHFPDQPERYQAIQEMFAQVTDACWDPEEESTQLHTVKTMLKTSGAPQVAQCPAE
jgi:hypothetical protein